MKFPDHKQPKPSRQDEDAQSRRLQRMVMRQPSQREMAAAWKKVTRIGENLEANGKTRRRLLAEIVMAIQEAKRLEKEYAA